MTWANGNVDTSNLSATANIAASQLAAGLAQSASVNQGAQTVKSAVNIATSQNRPIIGANENPGGPQGGPCYIFAVTYTVSVQFKTATGCDGRKSKALGRGTQLCLADPRSDARNLLRRTPCDTAHRMEGSEGLDDLERYLETAELLSWGEALHVGNTEPTGGHPEKHRVVLAGGVLVLAKPGHDQFAATVKREAAGWRVARCLGFNGLVAGTVLREVPRLSTGVEVLHSLQIMWPDGREWCASLDRFSDAETWRAAVFDAVVAHADHNGNNWFGVPAQAPGVRQHLRLVDTGNAFDLGGESVNSTFYEHHHGDDLPDYVMEGVQRLCENWPHEQLVELLGEEEAGRTRTRAERLLKRARLRVEAGDELE